MGHFSNCPTKQYGLPSINAEITNAPSLSRYDCKCHEAIPCAQLARSRTEYTEPPCRLSGTPARARPARTPSRPPSTASWEPSHSRRLSQATLLRLAAASERRAEGSMARRRAHLNREAEPLAHREVEGLDVRPRQLLQRWLLLLPRDPVRRVGQVLQPRPAGQIPPPSAGIHESACALGRKAVPEPLAWKKT